MVENALLSFSADDASYVVAWFFCGLAMELVFVYLVVRRESPSDLSVLQVLAAVPILNPVLEEVYLAAENPEGEGIGMGKTAEAVTALWFSQEMRVALLVTIILCALALAFTARRVRMEYAWRTQNAEGRSRRLASMLGAAFYLDVGLTGSLVVLLLCTDVRHVLGDGTASLVVSGTLVGCCLLVGFGFLLALFLLVDRPHRMMHAPTQRLALRWHGARPRNQGMASPRPPPLRYAWPS